MTSSEGQDWKEAFEEEHDARLEAEAQKKRLAAKVVEMELQVHEFQAEKDTWDATQAKLKAQVSTLNSKLKESAEDKGKGNNKKAGDDLGLSRLLSLEKKRAGIFERRVDELEMMLKQRDTNHEAIVSGMKDKADQATFAIQAKKRAQDELKGTKEQMIRLRAQVSELEKSLEAAQTRVNRAEAARKTTARRVQVLEAWKQAVAESGGQTREAEKAASNLNEKMGELKEKLAQEGKTRTRLMSNNKKLEVANQEAIQRIRELEAELLTAGGASARSVSRMSRSNSTPATPRLSFAGKVPLPPTPRASELPGSVPEEPEAQEADSGDESVVISTRAAPSSARRMTKSYSTVSRTPRSLGAGSDQGTASIRDLSSVRALVTEERRAKSEISGQLESLRRRLDNESAARVRAEKLLTELRADLTDLRGRHADLNKERKQLMTDLTASKRQVNSAQDEREKLAALLKTIRETHDLSDKADAQIRKAVPPGSVAEAEELRSTLAKVRERNEMLEQEVTLLREKARASALKFGLTPTLSSSSILSAVSTDSDAGSTAHAQPSPRPAHQAPRFLNRNRQLGSSSSSRSITQARKMIQKPDDKLRTVVVAAHPRRSVNGKQVSVPPGMSLPAVGSPTAQTVTPSSRSTGDHPSKPRKSNTISMLSLDSLML